MNRPFPKLFIGLATAMLLGVADAQTPSSTSAIGFYKFDVPAGQSAWVCGFVTKKDFQGQATSTAPGAPLPDSTPTTEITQSGATWAVDGFNLHYVEILTAGAQQGAILDVVSNTANTVTVKGSVTGAPIYCVRKHATLGAIFTDSSILEAYSDSVSVYNSDNTLSSYYATGVNGEWLADDFSTPANDAIIYPGQGFVIAATNPVLLTIGGGDVSYVKTGPTQIPVYRGQTNFVGLINPLVATSPSDPLVSPVPLISTPTTAGGYSTLGSFGLTSSGLQDYSDSITLYAQGGNLNPAGAYYTAGSDILADDFSTIANDTLLRNGYAFIVSVENDDRTLTLLPQNP